MTLLFQIRERIAQSLIDIQLDSFSTIQMTSASMFLLTSQPDDQCVEAQVRLIPPVSSQSAGEQTLCLITCLWQSNIIPLLSGIYLFLTKTIVVPTIQHYYRHVIVPKCLQSSPRESKDKAMAAMLVVLTRKENEKSIIVYHQHGDDEVTCKSSIHGFHVSHNVVQNLLYSSVEHCYDVIYDL